MKKLLIFLTLFFIGLYQANADLQIKAFNPASGRMFQVSETEAIYIIPTGGSNNMRAVMYDQNGNSLGDATQSIGYGATVSPGTLTLWTIETAKYIMVGVSATEYHADNYIAFGVIDKATQTRIYQGYFSATAHNSWDAMLEGNLLYIKTNAGVLKVVNIDTGAVATSGQYTTVNGYFDLEPQTRVASDNNGLYTTRSFIDPNGTETKHSIEYQRWGEVDATTVGIEESFRVFESFNNIKDYRVFGPYTNGVFLSIATDGPYNFYIDPDDSTQKDYNVISYTKDTFNDNFWKFYNSTVGDPRLFNLFIANSRFYYAQDPRLLSFNYDIGPFINYELVGTGTIDSVFYIDQGILYKKTDVTNYVGDIDADAVNTDNTQGTTGTGTTTTGTGNIEYDDSIFNFDQDGDGEVGLLNGEIFVGIGNVIKYFFTKIMDFFGNIKALVEKLSESFTSEVKTFSFVPSANAESFAVMFNTSVDETAFEQTTLGKFTVFFKGFAVFFVFIIGFVVFIGMNRKKG